MPLEFSSPVSCHPRGARRFEFKTYEDVRDWASGEIKNWGPFTTINLQQPFDLWRNEALNPVRELEGLLNTAISQGVDQHRDTVENYLHRYQDGPPIYSRSVIAVPILVRIQRGEYIAAAMLMGLANQRAFNTYIDGNNVLASEALGAFFESDTIAKSQKGLIAAHKKSTLELLEEFEVRFDAKMLAFDAALNEIKVSHDEILAKTSRADAQADRLRRWSLELIRLGREEYSRLRETYEKELQLSAPASYWASRSKRSMWSAVGGLVSFAGLAGVAGWALWKYFPAVRALIATDGKVDLGAVILVTPLVLLPIWLLRMVARFFSIGIIESADARQRTIMVSTFLALTKDPNSKLSDAERFLILQALFRSGGPQPNDDDGSPANFIELLTKVASGGKPH